jgi:hypothetical protein
MNKEYTNEFGNPLHRIQSHTVFSYHSLKTSNTYLFISFLLPS